MINIVRRDPFDELLRGFFVQPVGLQQNTEKLDLPVEIRESAEAFELSAELTGVRKEDIEVNINGNVLSISAERKASPLREGERLLRSEFGYGKLGRSFQLSQEINEAEAQARYSDGVLTLLLPKKAAAQARRLTVQ